MAMGLGGLFINTYLTGIYNKLGSIKDTEKAMPAAMTGDIYKNTKILTSMDSVPQIDGQRPTHIKRPVLLQKRLGGQTRRPIVFEVEAKRVTLLYRRDKKHPPRDGHRHRG